MEKPKNVKLAVSLMFGSLGLGVVRTLMNIGRSENQQGIGFVIVVALITLIIISFFIYKTSAGKNWARITLLVFFILGALPFLIMAPAVFKISVVDGVISLLQVILQGAALYLVFTKPGSEWFRKSKA